MNQHENKARAEEYLAEAAEIEPSNADTDSELRWFENARDYYLRAAQVHATLATIEDDPFVPEASVIPGTNITVRK